MKRITAFLLALVCTFYMTGCNEKTESTQSSCEESIAYSPAEHNEDYYVKWAVPDSISLSDETLDKINYLLESRYDMGLRLIPLGDIPGEIDYQAELKSCDADIAFIGFDPTDDTPCERLISEGFFAPLDDMLVGSELISLIPEKLWESTRYNGSIYTIPNETSQDIGVNIVFDLDKISKEQAESFDGDISSLPDMLGENGMLYYGIDGFSFAEYYGCYYDNGLIITPEGMAESLLDNKECRKWLSLFNSLYISGKADDNENADWSIAVAKDILRLEKKNIYCYKTKAVIGTRCSATTGILNSSDKKQRAFDLLEIVHKDKEIANLLVYGDGFTEKDGYAYDSEGELVYGFIGKLIFGLDTGVLRGSDMLISFETADEKIAYYDENVTLSQSCGVDLSGELSEVRELMNSDKDMWKSKSFDDDIAKLDDKLKEADIDTLTAAVNEKIKSRQQP